MAALRADEIISPLIHEDTDRVCVVSASLVGECAVCGTVLSNGGTHLPLITYGFRCAECCPCRTWVPSEAEAEAMVRNAAAGTPKAMAARRVNALRDNRAKAQAALRELTVARRAERDAAAEARPKRKQPVARPKRQIELTPERLASLAKARVALKEWHEKRRAQMDAAKAKALTDQ